MARSDLSGSGSSFSGAKSGGSAAVVNGDAPIPRPDQTRPTRALNPSREVDFRALDGEAHLDVQCCRFSGCMLILGRIVVEDHTASPAEIAATRMDFRAWLKILSKMQKKAATKSAAGDGR
jgi:hypothetical protein